MPLPMVLGHEAAGFVEKRSGPGCTQVKPGQPVILNFRPNCGWCNHCVGGRPVLCNGADTPRWFQFDGTVRLHRNGEDIHHFARIASFAEYAVVPESGAVPVRADMPLDKASLVGCSVMTGVGAVVNTAKVEPGAKVVVIGCGGASAQLRPGRAARRRGADRRGGHEGEQARLRADVRGDRHHQRIERDGRRGHPAYPGADEGRGRTTPSRRSATGPPSSRPTSAHAPAAPRWSSAWRPRTTRSP